MLVVCVDLGWTSWVYDGFGCLVYCGFPMVPGWVWACEWQWVCTGRLLLGWGVLLAQGLTLGF